MGSDIKANDLVKVRSANVDRYNRNFLKQVVCELRFPTLLELGESKPPASLVTALRKVYPNLEVGNEVTLGFGGSATGSNHVHTMRSSKGAWAVSLKQNALTIETSTYSDYAEMRKRILQVVNAAQKVIDTDFFTRVGLRYINVIDSKNDPADGWVIPVLVAPIRQGAFTNINEFAGKILLTAEDGGCLLQHGVRVKASDDSAVLTAEYFIDIDTYRNEVQLDDVGNALHAMHAQAFDMFDWTLGPKARDYLTANKIVKS